MNPQDYSGPTTYRPRPQIGRLRRTPVLRNPHSGDDYLVALAGESEWIRNVRAAGGRAVIRRRKAYPIRLVEVPVEERPPINSAYLRRGAEQSGSQAAAKQARFYFGLGLDPSLEEIRAIAHRYPVFRVVYGAERAPRSGNGAAAGAIGTGETP
jgi:hypothetical protein